MSWWQYLINGIAFIILMGIIAILWLVINVSQLVVWSVTIFVLIIMGYWFRAWRYYRYELWRKK